MNHNELKETWKLANEQFLEQQNNLVFELGTMRKLLTLQQLEQLSRDLRKIPQQPRPIKTVAEHPYQVTTQDTNMKPTMIKTSPSQASDLINFENVGGQIPSKQTANDTPLPETLLDKMKKLSPNLHRKSEAQQAKIPINNSDRSLTNKPNPSVSSLFIKHSPSHKNIVLYFLYYDFCSFQLLPLFHSCCFFTVKVICKI